MSLSPLTSTVLASGGLTDIDRTLFVSTLVLFLIFAGILAKFAWRPLLQMIEEREKGIREEIEGARKANADAQSLLDQHKEMVREAGREREELIKKALQEAEGLKSDLQARARTESDQMIQRARDQVEREKTVAIQELRSQVADLAVEAAAKIVTSSLTLEAQKKLVAEFVASVPKAQ